MYQILMPFISESISKGFTPGVVRAPKRERRNFEVQVQQNSWGWYLTLSLVPHYHRGDT